MSTVTVLTVHLASLLVPSFAWCAIPPTPIGGDESAQVQPVDFSLKTNDDFSKGFNIAAVKPMESYRDVKAADVQKMIPQDMAPTSSGGQVAAKIVDKSISSYFNSEAMRKTDIGQTATKVEKSMATDVSFGGQQPQSIHHSIKFQVQAAQAQAKLSYTGITNADLTYKAIGSTTNLEIHEPVAMLSTSLVFSHIDSPSDRKDMLSLRWVW